MSPSDERAPVDFVARLRVAHAGLYTLAMSERAMLEKAVGRPDQRVRELTKAWALGLARRIEVQVRSIGFDAVDFSRPVVIMANHQSFLDVLALYHAMPTPFGFVAKSSLFDIPAFGGVMRALGCVPITRGARRDAFKSIEEAARRVREGSTIAVFPEGTRTRGDRIAPLKKGSFYLVQAAQVPILPIGIRGTATVMPRSNTYILPGEVEVRAGRLIEPPKDRSTRSRKATMSAVRSALSELAAVPMIDA